MRNLKLIRDEIEVIVDEIGMSFFDDYEKVAFDEENVEVYKVKDVYCVLFYDNGDSLCDMDVCEKYDEIREMIW